VKFGHKKDIVPFLAGRLALMLQTNSKISPLLTDGQLFISFIPNHWRRKYLEKGYNQSELLAKELANQLGLRMISLAKKCKYTVSQVHLSKAQRANNLQGTFEAQGLEQIPYGATVVFVDDVTTTGTTLLQIAKVIKETRSDVHLWGIVVARNMG
jgi:predicted amidophosphoribosyltransferase